MLQQHSYSKTAKACMELETGSQEAERVSSACSQGKLCGMRRSHWIWVWKDKKDVLRKTERWGEAGVGRTYVKTKNLMTEECEKIRVQRHKHLRFFSSTKIGIQSS
jgi:hypothetical protein